MLLECEAGQDVAGRGGREQRVPGRHRGHRPGGEQNPAISECRMWRYRPRSVKMAWGGSGGRARQPGLAQAEHVEMADQEGGAQG
jgi:hypothetical protein